MGSITSVTDANGNTTAYRYNDQNLLTRVTDAEGNITAYTYDNVGNLLTQTNGNGNTITYSYNELNLLESREDPADAAQLLDPNFTAEVLTELYEYLPNGRLAARTDKNGVETEYTYDVHGRVLAVQTGGESTSYSYDAKGNLLQATDEIGTITRTYDDLNRTLSKSVPGFDTITFAYDITTGLTAGYVGESTTVDNRTTLRVYDKVGRLAEVRDGSDTTSYQYYNNGSLKKVTLPNNVSSQYTYYNNNRLKTLVSKHGTVSLESYQYTYDGVGNMTAKQDVKGTTTYTYTDLNQLEQVTEPSGRVTVYTYDGAGNRATEVVTEGEDVRSISYEVNARNQLTQTVEEASDGTTTIEQYFYDDAGNMLGRRPEVLTAAADENVLPSSLGLTEMSNSIAEVPEAVLYTYNEKNQLTEAITEETTVENSFYYDGYRATKTVGDVTTSYLYEGDRVIKEVDTEDSTVYNVYGTNLISREVDNDKVYYLYNGHGDVTALLTAGGTVLASYYYDAFGNIVDETGSFYNPIRYAGYTYDPESGLYDLKARYYDPKVARFMQEDTYWGSTDDTLSLNLYTYCSNNPLIYYDPTGHVVSPTDQQKLTKEEQAEIQKETDNYNRAKAQDDAEGMRIAHEAAELIRAGAGYSGGADGSGNYAIITEGGGGGGGNTTVTPVNTSTKVSTQGVSGSGTMIDLLVEDSIVTLADGTTPASECMVNVNGEWYYVFDGTLRGKIADENVAMYKEPGSAEAPTYGYKSGDSFFLPDGSRVKNTVAYTSNGAYKIDRDGKTRGKLKLAEVSVRVPGGSAPITAYIHNDELIIPGYSSDKDLPIGSTYTFSDGNTMILMGKEVTTGEQTSVSKYWANLGKPDADSGFYQLPESGLGYDTSGCDHTGGVHQWGTLDTIMSIVALGATWYELGHARKYGNIPIGDISKQKGGYLDPHSLHQEGLDVDIPIRRNAMGWTEETVHALVETIKATGNVNLVYYYDEFDEIIEKRADHWDHLHIWYE